MLAEALARGTVDFDFLKGMERDWADGVKRTTRLISQMRFLARDPFLSHEAFPLAPLLEEAYEEARKHQPVKAGQFKYESSGKPTLVTGDREALKHALAEVMLNGLQANPNDPKIGVTFRSDSKGNGTSGLQIEVQDNGPGFTPEAVQKAFAPFFTTRNVGLGLGLTVSRKIIETHHGKLEIIPADYAHTGVVRISLPLEVSPPATD
jgi:signal transduction histidine kinase